MNCYTCGDLLLHEHEINNNDIPIISGFRYLEIQ